jgi:hypothetical protein
MEWWLQIELSKDNLRVVNIEGGIYENLNLSIDWTRF